MGPSSGFPSGSLSAVSVNHGVEIEVLGVKDMCVRNIYIYIDTYRYTDRYGSVVVVAAAVVVVC